MRLWGASQNGTTFPSSAKEILQNMPVQRLKGGEPHHWTA